ncbi:hypothetical protein WJX74_010557 [Apatococcus lobatus]|uniref:Phosphodiesterase n=1 Tax=Apatococcus lobatus TaxID=904363 RepID=A0AAW1QAH4_9CHLO
MALCDRPGNHILSGEHLLKQQWTSETLHLLNHIWTPCWVMRARPLKDNGHHGISQQLENIWLSNIARSWFGDEWSANDLFKLNKLGMSSAVKSGHANAMSWQEIIQDVTMASRVHRFWVDMVPNSGADIKEFGPFVSEAAAQRMPIHSFLFDQQGLLLHANHAAIRRWTEKGFQLETPGHFSLENLFRQDGNKGDAATVALEAIFEQQQTSHRITLSRIGHTGKRRHVLYEMWLAEDPIHRLPAMLVSAADVTSQKELEVDLERARQQLLRQNNELEHEKQALRANFTAVAEANERLEAQQQYLAAQLKEALEFKLLPRKVVDTETPVDKAVSLMDAFLEGTLPSRDEIICTRNLLLSAEDLRQPMNLSLQLMKSSGLSSDVGQAMAELLLGPNGGGSQRQTPIDYDDWDGPLPELQSSTSQPNQLSSPFQQVAQHKKRSGEIHRPHSRLSHEKASSCSRKGSGHVGGAICSLDANMCDWSVLPCITSAAERLLQVAEYDHRFNVFELATATNNMPLSSLAFFYIKRGGFIEQFSLVEARLAEFLQAVEMGYNDLHPYHNRAHAASVLHVMHLLMMAPDGLRSHNMLHDVHVLAGYLAAACHDFEHPGVNNDFLIKTQDALALRYNDIAPLENHHASASVTLLRTDSCYFHEMMRPADQQAMKSFFIELVLATDMKRHFNIVSHFQGVFRPNKQRSGPSTPSYYTSGSNGWTTPGSDQTIPEPTLEQKVLAAQVALKCADIGHLSAQQQVHKVWTSRLEAEFFNQGDQERSRGLQVSALMDRENRAGITKSQVGFFEIIGLPLFQSFSDAFAAAKPVLEGASHNYAMWRNLADLQTAPSLGS